jgi:hypothetical protein
MKRSLRWPRARLIARNVGHPRSTTFASGPPNIAVSKAATMIKSGQWQDPTRMVIGAGAFAPRRVEWLQWASEAGLAD